MMIWSNDTIVRAWPVLVLAVLIAIVCYYMTKEDKETYYSPRAMDQYLIKIRQNIWHEAEKRLHELRNQNHAKILKTNDEVKKHKQAYLYSREFLLNDLAQNMGLYGHVPDYLAVYRESKGIDHRLKDSQIMRDMYSDILADTAAKIYYVYYDLDSHSYKWLNIAEAASKSNVPMSTKARNIVEAANMLSLHFEMGNKAKIDWHKLDKHNYLGFVVNENGETIKLLMNKPDNMSVGQPVRAQLYQNEARAKFVTDSRDLLSFDKLFDLALKKCTALRSKELKRIKDFNKSQNAESASTKKMHENYDKVINLEEKEKDER